MMNKVNDAALENAVGGATRTVKNTSAKYANVRMQPGLNTEVLYKADNGTTVETTGNKITRDGYTWYEIIVPGARAGYGWISGSLIGF